MDFQTYDASVCMISKIVKLVGGKWKPIILHLIRIDSNRFDLMMKRMPGISKKILAEQLRELEEDKLITKEIIEASAPQVIVYHLTEKGRSLRKLIDETVLWGRLNLTDEPDEKSIEGNSKEQEAMLSGPLP